MHVVEYQNVKALSAITITINKVVEESTMCCYVFVWFMPTPTLWNKHNSSYGTRIVTNNITVFVTPVVGVSLTLDTKRCCKRFLNNQKYMWSLEKYIQVDLSVWFYDVANLWDAQILVPSCTSIHSWNSCDTLATCILIANL